MNEINFLSLTLKFDKIIKIVSFIKLPSPLSIKCMTSFLLLFHAYMLMCTCIYFLIENSFLSLYTPIYVPPIWIHLFMPIIKTQVSKG